MARLLTRLSELAAAISHGPAEAFSGSVPEPVAAAMRDFFFFTPSIGGTSPLVLRGMSRAAVGSDIVILDFVARPPRGVKPPAFTFSPTVVPNCSGVATYPFSAGLAACSSSAGLAACSSAAGLAAARPSAAGLAAARPSAAGLAATRSSAAGLATTRSPAAGLATWSSVGGGSLVARRRFAGFGSVGSLGGVSFVRAASSCTKSSDYQNCQDCLKDCQTSPQRIALKDPTANEAVLHKLFEEMIVAQGRDYCDLKRAYVKLEKELNDCKAAKREAIITARREVGVIAFRMFVALGGFVAFFLKDFITERIRAELPEKIRAELSAALAATPPPTPPPAAPTTPEADASDAAATPAISA